MMTIRRLFILALLCTVAAAGATETNPVIGIIGTGDMGDSLGPRFVRARLQGRLRVAGTRMETRRRLWFDLTGGRLAFATTQRETRHRPVTLSFSQCPGPRWRSVAQNLGPLDGKIVIDISFPHEQGEDGYYVPMLETSSAEMIQQWNPGARVMKTFALQASYVIDDPDVVGGTGHHPDDGRRSRGKRTDRKDHY